jgi:two-component system OmpR family sensor kinase
MNDGGRFRTEPTGERVVDRRGQPLATHIAAIVAVVLLGAFGAAIGIAYPFIHSSAVELSRTGLSNQADALSRFLGAPDSASTIGTSIPPQIVDILNDHHVTAILVPPTSKVVAPMLATDRLSLSRRGGVSAIRTEPSGVVVLYEYRALEAGYGLYLTQPESIADEPTRVLLLRMAYGALVALICAIAAVVFFTRRATAPIRDAVVAAERMAEGARDVRLVEGGHAEMADLSRSMNELSDALAHSEDRQRQFLLSVSHELRTPLTAIAGYAEALADGFITDADIEPTGAVMRDESERLQRLVSDLLDLARAGAVELRLDAQSLDLRDVLTNAGQVWRDRCDREGLLFSIELPTTPLPVTTDPVRVRQIIDNLCENALRVTPAGRPLVISASDVPGGVEFQVRDGGPGLSDDDLLVAFQPSALHDRYYGIRPVGTGLGLALVGTLAARLGGKAVAGRSAEGGACFSVFLPREWRRLPASEQSPNNV